MSLLQWFVVFCLLIGAAACAHEAGHLLAAMAFKKSLVFRFEFGDLFLGKFKIKVPGFVWDMPEIELWKQRVIAASGFALEIAVSLIYWALTDQEFTRIYLTVVLLHLMTYGTYAGDKNDFNWFKSQDMEG